MHIEKPKPKPKNWARLPPGVTLFWAFFSAPISGSLGQMYGYTSLGFFLAGFLPICLLALCLVSWFWRSHHKIEMVAYEDEIRPRSRRLRE